MTDTRYNGWTNYETWNLALWIGNEQGSYEYWQEQTRDAYDHARETINPSFTRLENAALDLAERLKTETEENMPTVSGFYADVLTAAIQQVNYHEIATSWLDDLDKTDEDLAAMREPDDE